MPQLTKRDYQRIVVVVAFLGLLLAVLAWPKPNSVSTSSKSATKQEAVFDYVATVPPSPAYQGTEVRPPDPVFRTLANVVMVDFVYSGSEAILTPKVKLSSSNGWRWVNDAGPPVQALGGEAGGSVVLNLDEISAQATAGAQAIGVPAGNVNVTVVLDPGDTGDGFEPKLELVLTGQSLSLKGDVGSLVSSSETSAQTMRTTANSVSLLFFSLNVVMAKALSLLLILGAGLGWYFVRRLPKPTQAVLNQQALRRHKSLIVPVAEVTVTHKVIEVASFEALVKLARRYALLVMHESAADQDYYYVQDETGTYRWTAGDSESQDNN